MSRRRLHIAAAGLAVFWLAPCFGQSMPAHPANPAPSAPAPPAIGKAQPTGLDVLRTALVQVCSRHPAVERCFLVLAQDGSKKLTGIWFVPIFDRSVDNTALGEAQQVYMKLFPGTGQLPMLLLSRQTWRKQMAGVAPIYVRKDKP